MKIDFKKIYVQESININPVWRRNADVIINRFPQAELIPVISHWQIEDLFGADPAEWMKNKKDALVLGVKSGLRHVKTGARLISSRPQIPTDV